jgi:hypothetical protein
MAAALFFECTSAYCLTRFREYSLRARRRNNGTRSQPICFVMPPFRSSHRNYANLNPSQQRRSERGLDMDAASSSRAFLEEDVVSKLVQCRKIYGFVRYTSTTHSYKKSLPLAMLLFFHQGFSTACKIRYFITAVTATLSCGSAGILAFIDNLKFKATTLTDVDFAFLHLMTIRHGLHLLLLK